SLSSHLQPEHVAKDAAVLERLGFPAGEMLFPQPEGHYADGARRDTPDVLVEFDCESSGGQVEMTYPSLRPDEQAHLTGIVVRELEGIDHLADTLVELRGVRAEDERVDLPVGRVSSGRGGGGCSSR